MNQHSRLEKILLAIIYIGSALVVAVPLIVVPGSYFPYIIVKTIIWRAVVEAVVLAWLVLICYFPQYRPKRTLLFWVLGFFTLVWLLSSFTGSSFTRSFWGNWERMGGSFNFAHYFLWWLVLVSVFKNIKQWYRLLNFSLLVSLAICLYALGQRFGSGLTLESGLTRVNGTIGNAAYLAAYLLFHIFIAWYFFIKGGSWPKRLFYLGAFTLQVFILLLTSTRGAQLAFLLSLVLFLIASFIFNFYREKGARLFVGLSLIVVIFGLFVLFFHNQPWVKDNYYLGRFSNFSFKDNTIQTRLISWRAGLQGLRDHLLLGVGPENYQVVFNRYLDPQFYKYTGDEVWFDRAHNSLMDMAVMLGLFGLLGYLAIFVAVFYILWRFYKNQGYASSLTVLALIFAAYFVENVFVFDSLNSYIPLFLILGFIDFLSRLNSAPAVSAPEKERKIFKLPVAITATLALVIFAFSFFRLTIQEVQANQYTYKAFVIAQQSSDYQDFFDNYEKSLRLAINPIDPTFLLVQNLPDMIVDNLDKLPPEKIKADFAAAAEYANRAIKLDPENIFNYYLLAKLYNGFAELTKDGQYLSKALEILAIGQKLAPTTIRLYWVEAQTYIIAGKYEEAIVALDKSIALIDSVPDPYWFKYVIYRENGQEELAYEAATKTIKYNYHFRNPSDVKELILYYEKTGADDILAKLYRKVIDLQPKELPYYEKLVSLYDKQGKYQQAMSLLKEAATAVPTYSDRAFELYQAIEKKLSEQKP